MRYVRQEPTQPLQELDRIQPQRYQPGRYGVNANIIQLGGGYNRPVYYGFGRGRTMGPGPISRVMADTYQRFLKAQEAQKKEREAETAAQADEDAYNIKQEAGEARRTRKRDEIAAMENQLHLLNAGEEPLDLPVPAVSTQDHHFPQPTLQMLWRNHPVYHRWKNQNFQGQPDWHLGS